MNIAIYEVKEIDHWKENQEVPTFIIWDLDEMKRISTARTYEKACEIKKDLKKLKC